VEFGGEVEEGVRESIEARLRAVEQVLEAVNAATQVGDAAALKREHKALDEATQPLADAIMDRLSAAMLEKRGLI